MKLFFHIGQAKTGSSAIQSYLNYNRAVLAKNHHILYPNFNTPDLAEKSFYHNHANFFHLVNESETDNKYEEISNCIEYSIRHGINKIVFSAEMFEFQWLPILIKEAATIYKFDYSIILYLRRQDHYLEAAWKQWGHKRQDVKTIQDYISKVHLDWNDTIKKWLKQIPPEKFLLQTYEKAVIGDDIIRHFMSLLGVNTLDDFTAPPENSLNNNHGLNTDVIELMRLCKTIETEVHNNSFLAFIYNILPASYKKPPMVNYNFLSPSERLKIIEQYTDSNNEIASIFFGGNEALFKEPLPKPDEPWEPYCGLTLEKTIPIFMEMFLNFNKEINQLKQSIHINKVIFKFDVKDLFHKSKFNKQIVNKIIINNEVHFDSLHDDPIIILPKIKLPVNYIKLRLDITVPEITIIQLFYRRAFYFGYNEEKSIKMNSLKGRNVFVFKIQERNINTPLRLDPGCHSGRYIIHNIEFIE